MTRPKRDSATQLARQGIQPDYFTMIPNMAIADLKPAAFKLLMVYLDMSATGDIYAQNKTVAGKLGTSINTMKNARKELFDKGYILLAIGKDGKDTHTADVTIKLDWMWQKNHEIGVSKSKKGVSNSDTMPSNSDSGVSNPDTNKQYLYNNTPISITQEKEKEPTPAPTAHLDKTTSPFADTSYKGLYAVVAKHSFKFQEGEKIPKSTASRIGKVVKGIMELDDIPTAAELIRVYRFDREVHSDISVPNQDTTVINIVKEFRQASDYKQYVSDKDRVLSSLDSVSSAPPPVLTFAAVDAALYHNPPQAVIDAAPEYPMSPEEQIAWDEAQAKILAMINRGKKQPPRMPPQPQKAG